jgi:hypothetical protein
MVVEVLWCPNGGRLVVELPDHGALIRCELATDTFVEVIKRIGIERVKSLGIEIAGIPLISTTEYPNRRQYHVGEYYITGGLSPEDMARRLRQIAGHLNIILYAELFP